MKTDYVKDDLWMEDSMTIILMEKKGIFNIFILQLLN
jgi:hypothetical protein